MDFAAPTAIVGCPVGTCTVLWVLGAAISP